MSTASFNLGFVVNPAPQPTGVIPAYPLSQTHPDWPSFLQTCRNVVAGSGQTWNFGIGQLANCWAALGRTDNGMRDWCVNNLRLQLAAAMTKWNANQNLTEFSGDSYLYCGDRVSLWVLVLNWMRDQLTAQEIADASMILDRAVWNIWNYTQAKWGTATYAWSGWATSNPLNNYWYRAHTKATLWWGIHSQNQTWLDKMQTQQWPLGVSRYQQYMAGGGSLEGTGYGQSYYGLFQNIWLWRSATGQDLSLDLRVPEIMAFWVNATTPDYRSFAPFGDQSRVSYPSLYDYQRAILVWGTLLCPNTPEADLARGWLTAAGRRAGRPENIPLIIFDTSGPATVPPDGRAYLSSGVGQVLAKDFSNGVMLSLSCGLFWESHAHQDQSEFQIYHSGKWRCSTVNIWGNSGIAQAVDWHNCLLFRTSAGVSIAQARSQTRNGLTLSDDGVTLDAVMDLKPAAYGAQPNIQSCSRRAIWDRAQHKLTVRDDFAVINGVTATFRLTVSDLPTVNPDGSVTAGPLTIRCLTPGVTVTARDWNTLSTNVAANKAWLIEFSGGTVNYEVEITY